VRSPYWDFVVEPGLSWQVSPQWKLEARSAMEWLQYDESTEIYFDLWVGRVGLLMGRRFGSLEVGVEPRWSWLVSTEPVEDQYEQPSVLFRFDWFRQGRFWISLTEEIGRRDYVKPLPDGLQLYSDYTFFRTSVLGSVTIDEHLSLDVFVSDEPESHHRSEDDGRLTLLTLSLRWTF
jgi:hypothetical protein